MRLKDKVALITGSTRGIGRAIAKAYATEGASVFIVGNQGKKMLDETIYTIKKDGGIADGGLYDISKESEVEALFKNLDEVFGSLDILVNNAGIIKPTSFVDLQLDDWQKTMAVHLNGTFLCTQYAVKKYMIAKNQGKIINLSAPAAFKGTFGVADYATAKGGICAFTKNLAKELMVYNVQVNAVVPVASTRMTAVLNEFYKTQFGPNFADYLDKLPDPEYLAPLFIFLACRDSDYITGQVIAADGGLTV
jgi:3-oxoacyl-[acyl-carrier protein] reductase